MAREPTSHEEFAKNWSPARHADDLNYQKTKVNGWSEDMSDNE